MAVNVREHMQPLELLDLSKVHTVSELVRAMSKCSFGARMLGEVADTLTEWCRKEETKPVIVHDRFIPLDAVRHFCGFNYATRVVSSNDITKKMKTNNAVFVGHYSAALEEFSQDSLHRAIYINSIGQCPPRLVTDGHFPDVVFAAPEFIMPVLFATVSERLNGKCITVTDFFSTILPGSGSHGYFGLAREVVHAAHVLLSAMRDPECALFLTISGAMTIAQMGLLVCDLIDSGRVKMISATGALMGHGLVASMGLKHYKHHPRFTDEELKAQAINRVTDTYEPEENFDHIEEVVREALTSFDGSVPISPSQFYRKVGEVLSQKFPNKRGILKSAYEKNVPILTPAFVDSEVGNDVFVENMRRKREGKPRLIVDPELDTELLLETACSAKRRAIFSIGGGVPRNNTQNVAPLQEIVNNRLGLQLPNCEFYYGCRIDPTPLYYGNLSGCTYKEGSTWRKFDMSGDANLRFAEVHADATIVWPFIQKFIFDNV